MNKVIKQLLNRRSVRAFDTKDINKEDLSLIKQSILRAPTAGNMCFYSVIIVNDQYKKDELSLLCDNQPMIAKAPLVMVFLADMQKHMDYFKYSNCEEKSKIPNRLPGLGDFHLAMQDAIVAAQSAVVAADSLNIGSCYIGDIVENFERVQSLLALPNHAVPAAMLIMGYKKDNKEKKLLDRCDIDALFMEDSYKSKSKEELDVEWSKPLEHLKKTNRVPYEDATMADCFYTKKYTSTFMEEMNRSTSVFINKWLDK
ncbi:MAG: nitroreductase family protein [Spirochaetaceae bacterium]|nr:nitroreductase family protein [Spirochaetaceae bacterium]